MSEVIFKIISNKVTINLPLENVIKRQINKILIQSCVIQGLIMSCVI